MTPPLSRRGTAQRRRFRLGLVLAPVALLMACALPPRPAGDSAAGSAWSGRLALQVHSEPPQQFSAGFELYGSAQQGELTLTSPLGQRLAQAQWTPGAAWLVQGGARQAYPDMGTLTSATTGTALPIDALFQWLQGRPANADGWEADLSRHADGRITATRTHPLPAVQLRLVFQ